MEKKLTEGADRMTIEVYLENLAENISHLVEVLKKHSYKPQPVRRVFIPKGKSQNFWKD